MDTGFACRHLQLEQGAVQLCNRHARGAKNAARIRGKHRARDPRERRVHRSSGLVIRAGGKGVERPVSSCQTMNASENLAR